VSSLVDAPPDFRHATDHENKIRLEKNIRSTHPFNNGRQKTAAQKIEFISLQAIQEEKHNDSEICRLVLCGVDAVGFAVASSTLAWLEPEGLFSEERSSKNG
jgi:hypothetical protein